MTLVSRNNRGFTLVELLLALAVFAYAASSIMKLVSTSATSLSEIEKMTFASWVANNRLAELQVDKTWPPKDKAKGEVEMAGQTWFWQQKVLETEDKRLRSVTVTVSLDKSGNSSLYDLSTYLTQYVPEKKN